MASGKKNYFRHSFSARNDDKVQDLIQEFGLAGYYYWFALVELCAEQASNELKEWYAFHPSTLRRELFITSPRLAKVLAFMESSLLLEYTMGEKRISLKINKLAKYMGKYSTKLPPNAPNKRKEKEKKVNNKINNKKPEIEIVKSVFDFNFLYQQFPRKSGKKRGIELCNKLIKTKSDFDALKQSITNYAQQCKDNGTEQKYIKQFSTFMNCWEDYVDLEIEKPERVVMLEWFAQSKMQNQNINKFKGHIHDV